MRRILITIIIIGALAPSPAAAAEIPQPPEFLQLVDGEVDAINLRGALIVRLHDRDWLRDECQLDRCRRQLREVRRDIKDLRRAIRQWRAFAQSQGSPPPFRLRTSFS